MENFMKTLFMLISILSFSSAHAKQALSPILKVAKSMNYSFYTGRLEQGYTAKELKVLPKFSTNLKRYLLGLESEKTQAWKEFIAENPEYTEEEKIKVLDNPKKELGVKYLVQIDEVYAIYKYGELIGLVITTTDHVQGAIYQDGAGIDLYLDADMNVLHAEDWSA